MTISSTNRKAGPFIGNDSTTACPFAFKVFNATDLLVVRLNSDTGVETTLVRNTDYTVTLNSNQNSNPGGTVTLSAAIATGFTVTITTNVAELQPTDLTNQGGFFPQVVTTALDRLTVLIQQLSEKMGRSLKIPLSVPTSVSTDLPFPESNKLLGWNATGDGLQNIDGATLATIVAFGTAVPDLFSGDGSTTQFVLSKNPGALGNLDVAIGGVTQRPTVDYTWSTGTTITFTSPPPAPSDGNPNILVRYIQALPQGYGDSASVSFSHNTTYGIGTTGLALQSVINVKNAPYNARGDGSTDDSAAISAAVSAAASGARIYFPPGVYVCAAPITITGKSLYLHGAGQDGTIIKFTGGGNGFTINNSGMSDKAGFAFSDLAIVTTANGVGTAISFSGNAGAGLRQQLQVRDCFIGGNGYSNAWQRMVLLSSRGDFSRFDNVYFRGNSSDRTKVSAAIDATDSTDCKVIGCYFYWVDIGVSIGNFSEGWVVRDNHFAPVTVGVRAAGSNTGNYVVVDNNHMDAFGGGVVIGTSGVNGVNHSKVTKNLIFKNGSSTASFIGINVFSSFCHIEGNEIRFAGTSGSENGIILGSGSTYNTIIGNHISDSDGAAIYMIAGATNNTVTANTGGNNATDVLDSGTNNAVWGNNFDEDAANGTVRKELYGSTVWNPGTVAAGSNAFVQITITGATFGDFVLVSPPYDVQDTVVRAFVQNTNVVQIYLYNSTGVSKTFASGTWKAKVLR